MSAENKEIKSDLKSEFWWKHIEECQRSHSTQKEYCHARDLALSPHSVIGKRNWEQSAVEQTTSYFYPLTVQHLPQQQSQPIESGLLLELGKGKFRIEIAETFSAACLTKLIATLEVS